MECGKLKELAAQKEKEWKEITDLRIQSLEAELKEKNQVLEEERAKFLQLKEDFKYNLKLVGERDQELEHYDQLFRELRKKITVLNTENSELKIKTDELKSSLAREIQSKEELQIHYQQRIREKQKEIDNFTRTKHGEVEKERKEYESFKRKLERRLCEVEDELELQRRELTTGFDDAMKKHEHEYRVNLDEMNSQVLAHELKAKLLTKELEMIKSAQSKTSDEFQQVETNHKELENRLKKKDWELADLKSVKDSQISELEGKLSRSEAMVKKLQQGFEQRYAELDKYGREKEAMLSRLKEGFLEKEEGYKDSLHKLQTALQNNQVELRQLQWSSQDLLKEKDLQAERLSSELQDLRVKFEQQVIEISREQVSKDVRYQDMRSQVDKLTLDLSERKEDIKRYKRELSVALQRESELERSKAQLDLDWQRRYEDVERVQYSKSEELVSKLTKARDEALATLKEKDREIKEQRELIQALHRNTAHSQVISGSDVSEVEELRIQNKNLMSAIGEMREVMEELGHEVKLSPANQITVTKDYTKSLENEVSDLKKENRNLKERLENQSMVDTPDEVPCKDVTWADMKDNVLIQSHVKALNDSLGMLRAEKVELTAQLKKQQARMDFLDRSSDQSSKQVREKQLEVDQLQYEFNAEKRRQKAELAGLKQRGTELELELIETRKEADEYYRAGLERNMEVTNLRAELSNLRLELAKKRPAINFGAQELVIQQLEDELNKLRKHGGLMMSGESSLGSGQGLTTNATIEQLQNKLKSAAKHIKQLAKDKQLLIEIGNRQRAELLKAGITPPSASMRGNLHPADYSQPHYKSSDRHEPPTHPMDPPSRQVAERLQDKLEALEKLQYQLTKQELEYAQKFSPPRSSQPRQPNRPVSVLKKSTDSMLSEGGFGMSTITDGRTDDELQMTLTSAGGDSLQDVWRVLNQPSPSPVPSKRHDRDPKIMMPSKPEEYLVAGKKAALIPQEESQTANKQKRTVTHKKSQKPKVRNYNHRDQTNR